MYDDQPHNQLASLDAMNAGCEDLTVEDCRGPMTCQKINPLWLERQDIRCG